MAQAATDYAELSTSAPVAGGRLRVCRKSPHQTSPEARVHRSGEGEPGRREVLFTSRTAASAGAAARRTLREADDPPWHISTAGPLKPDGAIYTEVQEKATRPASWRGDYLAQRPVW
jgi:hypothetical protein